MKTSEPFDVLSLMPADTPAYMAGAWIGCLRFAISTPEVVKAFRRDTGETWTPSRVPLERMIDEATGRDRAFLEAFIGWVNVYVWGPIDGRVEARS